MDYHQSSADPAHPPPGRETRACAACGGEGYVLLDARYDAGCGVLTKISGPCASCKGAGSVSVYLYGVGA